MFSFGWWSTGRDMDAVNLFDAVCDAIRDNTIRGAIAYCFISREEGEGEFSDMLAERCNAANVPVYRFSAARFMPDLRKSDRERWRTEYHNRVLQMVRQQMADVVVLAGYMWVVSRDVCDSLSVINLHPASPDGPAGTWQEVIWQLMKIDASETGVMMHLVTPELDKGPPVTFCKFRIKGGKWSELWDRFAVDREKYGLQRIEQIDGESYPLFAKIRSEGVRRELPLIVHTLGAMSRGDVNIQNGYLVDNHGKLLTGPFDLTEAIEAEIY